jgi:GT2 family glycosyltransferase
MKISVVVCSRTGIPKQLKDSLSLQTVKPDEIIEITGSSLTQQRNEGVKQSTGDLITFFDDDIILDRRYIENIIKTFYMYPDAMAVTGNIIVKAFKPNILHTIFAHIFILSRGGKGRFLSSGFPETYRKDIVEVTKSEVLHGCNMTIRRKAFEEISFNEDLEGGMFGEDDWFSYELSRKYAVYYTPFALCYDNRDYPHGTQAWRTRCIIINLIKRFEERNPPFWGKVAFWWSMIGFLILKTIESLITKDMSILKGIYGVTRFSKLHRR